VPVAGYFPAGEVTVTKVIQTEWEEKPVNEQVCDYRWDPFTGKDQYSCKNETKYKKQPVQKTRFHVAGSGLTTVAYETVHQAFGRIAPTDYWRRRSWP
jgi:hypothetical protein